MAPFRGIQEYIARDANNIARFVCNLTKKKKSAIVSDCQLPFYLFTNSAFGVRACVERPSSGNIQVTESPPREKCF